MSDDDSRGNESPDRQDESTPDDHRSADRTADDPIRTALEALDTLTRALHANLRNPPAGYDGRPLTNETIPETRRRCREIRAEASHLGLLLYGPEAAIPYNPNASATTDHEPSGATVYSGPEPDAFERERRQTESESTNERDSESDSDRTQDRDRGPEARDRDDHRDDADAGGSDDV